MRKYLEKLRDESGFTLIEMLIVIMIVSLLLLLVMTNVSGVQKTAKDTTDEGVIQTVKSQMVIYEMEKGTEASADILEQDGYINKQQLKAYKAALNKPKDP